MPRKPVKEKSLHTTALLLRALPWSLVCGFGLGIGIFLHLAHTRSLPVALLGAVATAVLATALFTAGALALAQGAATSVGAFTHPSGRTTPAVREYSLEAALVARGWTDAAEDAYRHACAENPDDPEPRIRLARLLRDQLGRPAEAVEPYQAALRVPAIAAGPALLAARELIELLAYRLDDPGRALSELARLAQQHAGTPLGEWAAQEKKRWKEKVTAPEGEEG